MALTWKENYKLYFIGLSLHGRITKELNKSSREQGNELIVFIRHPHCSNSKPLENILGNPHYSTHFWSTLCLILTCELQLYRCHMPVWYLTYCWVSESFWHQLSDSPHHNQGTFVDRKKKMSVAQNQSVYSSPDLHY